ncbi:anaphase promoting complex subunit 11 [Spathaspora passalidarum NRRL Y-27907]|uniref:Anaphase-promoting complex subunit 11 n=1 Tax=Spathaspora passalidarum (strain NRRL Y-27907 / 11-Y1) TaxID=619300 RepID=G3AIA2_SPAPN|nr:anaphase promoting complex subunit 11 [Spathaspora passalidarum NRRL Y-27907]EGW33672.1 anaphase promoting complex subunit 11 [Spathaspora passalidarum NRRL Y-27907]
MKVKILEWKSFATWHWDLATSADDSGYVEELCGICRVSFDGTCPNCKYPGDDCPIVLGSGCTHNFHLHCILKWLEQESSKGLCPMCRQIFTFKEPEQTSDVLINLKTLIDGHRVMRERFQQGNEQEFEAFGADQDLQMA